MSERYVDQKRATSLTSHHCGQGDEMSDYKIPDYMSRVAAKKPGDKLTVEELACALYEGMPHVQNLAENMARKYGKAEALSFFDLMDPEVHNFWFGIAKQIIDHSKEWEKNSGSACCLSKREQKRLKSLPRVETK